MTQSSDLPFGSEFSPSQIELAAVLELAAVHQGDVPALQRAIEGRFFAQHGGGSEQNRRKLAMNCRLGMKAYGLIDDEARLTEFGRTLYDLRGDQAVMYQALARHILLHRNGMALIQCIRDMNAAGEVVNLTSLRPALAERGIHYPPGGKHPSIMRLWLEKAGVFVGSRWQINEARLAAILDIDATEFAALAHLTTEQRAFLLALANSGVVQPQPANEIARLAAAVYGVRFPEKSMPKSVLNALVDAGYITVTKTTGGRGAKPFLVEPTAKLGGEIVSPLLDQLRGQTDSKLFDLLRQPLTAILPALDSTDRYVSGLALEALAIKLMRIVGLEYSATRSRRVSTSGAEVDLLFGDMRSPGSNWQVKCSNGPWVDVDCVATQVGLASFLKTTPIVLVTTGQIERAARRFADQVMSSTNLAIMAIDGADIGSVVERPTSMVDILHRETSHMLRVKNAALWALPRFASSALMTANPTLSA